MDCFPISLFFISLSSLHYLLTYTFVDCVLFLLFCCLFYIRPLSRCPCGAATRPFDLVILLYTIPQKPLTLISLFISLSFPFIKLVHCFLPTRILSTLKMQHSDSQIPLVYYISSRHFTLPPSYWNPITRSSIRSPVVLQTAPPLSDTQPCTFPALSHAYSISATQFQPQWSGQIGTSWIDLLL